MKLKNYMAVTTIAASLLMANSADAQWTRNAVTSQTYLTNLNDNLGVGTANPMFKVDVQSTGIATMSFKSSTDNASFLLDRGASNKTASLTYRTAGTNNWQTGCVANNNFQIRNNALATATLFCDALTNNVGIGTTAPGANRLSVAGNGYFSARVGVGIVTPAAKLDVLGGIAAGDTIQVIKGTTSFTGAFDVIAVSGQATSTAAGYGIGVQGVGNYSGVFASGGNYGVIGLSSGVGVDGEASDATNTNDLTGVQGIATGGNISVGVYGTSTGATNNYGVYADQQDTAGPNYAVVCVGDLYYWRAFQASDPRLKTNIKQYNGALDKVVHLNASTYNFNHAKYPGMKLPNGNQIGFLADNVEQFFPELVKTSAIPAGATRDARGKVTYHSIPDVKAVNYVGLIPVLAEAIKEQKQQVDQKEVETNARISQLEKEVAELKSMLTQKMGKVTETGSLLQNVPNPANAITTINFILPENSKGILQITDAQGKVAKSFNVSGTGMQSVVVNTTSLSSGTYTYSLNINGAVADSKTMIISK